MFLKKKKKVTPDISKVKEAIELINPVLKNYSQGENTKNEYLIENDSLYIVIKFTALYKVNGFIRVDVYDKKQKTTILLVVIPLISLTVDETCYFKVDGEKYLFQERNKNFEIFMDEYQCLVLFETYLKAAILTAIKGVGIDLLIHEFIPSMKEK